MTRLKRAGESLRSELSTQIIAGLAVVFILYLIGGAVGLLPSIISVGRHFLAHLLSTARIPLWSLWVLIGTVIFTIVLLLNRWRGGQEAITYTEDSFFGMRVKWSWRFWSLKPKKIKLLCPRCGTHLVSDSEFALQGNQTFIIPSTAFFVLCELCNTRITGGNVGYNEDRAYRQIMRNLDTGDWRKRVQS